MKIKVSFSLFYNQITRNPLIIRMWAGGFRKQQVPFGSIAGNRTGFVCGNKTGSPVSVPERCLQQIYMEILLFIPVHCHAVSSIQDTHPVTAAQYCRCRRPSANTLQLNSDRRYYTSYITHITSIVSRHRRTRSFPLIESVRFPAMEPEGAETHSG